MDISNPNKEFLKGFSGPLLLLSLGLVFLVFKDARVLGGYLLDGQDYITGRDFVNFWAYGVAFWQNAPALNYDPYHYNAWLDALIAGFNYPNQLWSYPPHLMLIMAPFGLLTYGWAFAIFNLISIVIFWRVVVAPFQAFGTRAHLIGAPFLVIGLISGQFSLLVVAAFVWLYRNMDTAPVRSAILISLLTLKPQLGILIPFFLMLTGRWRLLSYCVGSVAIFIGASLLITGVAPWVAYFDTGIKMQEALLAKGGSTALVLGMMPTVLINASLAGLSAMAAKAVHIAYAVPVFIWFCWFVRRGGDHLLQYGALVAATFAITPYLMVYDMLVVVWLLLELARRIPMSSGQQWGWRFYMLLPIISVLMARVEVPGAALLSLLPIVWLTQISLTYRQQPTAFKTA